MIFDARQVPGHSAEQHEELRREMERPGPAPHCLVVLRVLIRQHPIPLPDGGTLQTRRDAFAHIDHLSDDEKRDKRWEWAVTQFTRAAEGRTNWHIWVRSGRSIPTSRRRRSAQSRGRRRARTGASSARRDGSDDEPTTASRILGFRGTEIFHSAEPCRATPGHCYERVRVSSHRKCNFANKSVVAPVKANVPLLLDDHLLDQNTTESLSRRFLRGWTTRLHPA